MLVLILEVDELRLRLPAVLERVGMARLLNKTQTADENEEWENESRYPELTDTVEAIVDRIADGIAQRC